MVLKGDAAVPVPPADTFGFTYTAPAGGAGLFEEAIVGIALAATALGVLTDTKPSVETATTNRALKPANILVFRCCIFLSTIESFAGL